jgi:pimeloyl-ACP methyl ester carboxylesterase
VVGCSLLGEKEPPQGTFELPNGRSLYMECIGSDSPTIILEAAAATAGADMFEVQRRLARKYMTCTYDRANIGSSSKAPTPRTAGDVVTDLHQLLESADVPDPYVLAGYGNGGFFVQLYGRRYSDEVAGVVAMSPPTPAHPWLERALPRFNKEERKEEIAFYRGENPEHINWLASSKELKKAPPSPHKPFEMLFYTKRTCQGYPPCLKSYDVQEDVLREVAQQWPEGRFRTVATYKSEIYLEKPGLVVDTVKRVASMSGG